MLILIVSVFLRIFWNAPASRCPSSSLCQSGVTRRPLPWHGWRPAASAGTRWSWLLSSTSTVAARSTSAKGQTFLFPCSRGFSSLFTAQILPEAIATSFVKFKGSSFRNENLLKMCSPSGHPRCGWVCFFIRFGEIKHYITCSPMDPQQWMGAVRMRVQTDKTELIKTSQ